MLMEHRPFESKLVYAFICFVRMQYMQSRIFVIKLKVNDMDNIAYQKLKNACRIACHERHACEQGFKQMIASENVSQMMATWRDNWEDVTESKYADIICKELPKLYPTIKEEMNKAGIYLNECPLDAKPFVMVIVTDCLRTVKIFGEAKAYILGEAIVKSYDHSQVYSNRCDKSQVALYNFAYGKIQKGTVTAYDRSRFECSSKAVANGCVECIMNGGEIHVMDCKKVKAYNGTIVYSPTINRIYLDETSQIKTEQK